MHLRRLILAAAIALAPLTAPAQVFQTEATSAIVIDHNSGQVLLSKAADVPLPPASMSKLMTLNMVFEALEDGRLSLDTMLPVSQHAMDYGGSTMFLNTRDRVRVEDLIRGVIVLSGNDACAVLAEALSPDGTEMGFARMMTQRAQQLGMTNSTFQNSNGWPAPGHVMSMADLALLAERLISEFPQYYTYFAETEFAFDGRAPANTRNRNPLLPLGIGADGLKTGHTQEAGYGLVGSAVQGDRRVTFVISGLGSERARASESERIVNWAFRQFAEKVLFKEGVPVMQADVFLGDSATVPLVAAGDISVLVPTLGAGDVTAEVRYSGPLAAPFAAGTPAGDLVIRQPGFADVTVPLVTGADVGTAGILRRIQTAGASVVTRVVAMAQ